MRRKSIDWSRHSRRCRAYCVAWAIAFKMVPSAVESLVALVAVGFRVGSSVRVLSSSIGEGGSSHFKRKPHEEKAIPDFTAFLFWVLWDFDKMRRKVTGIVRYAKKKVA